MADLIYEGGDDTPFAQNVAKALRAKGVNASCPMCQRNNWIILEGTVNIPIQLKGGSLASAVYGRAIPSVVLVCQNCGHQSFHSAKLLGIG